jgi:proteasome alpha subunit
MYEEPYRWVEAVGNRRQYLDEQFRQGSPVVALSYADGLLLLTVSRGTPKLYEIYDRIGLGGMGHPADLEKLRFGLLEMAHLEGFNRSPSDVTSARLMKYGLAPMIKQAFEEIFKAPHIVKIVLAELGTKAERDAFLTVNYDGTFEESSRCAALAASPEVHKTMVAAMTKGLDEATPPLREALRIALQAWALGSCLQRRSDQEESEGESGATVAGKASELPLPDEAALLAHLRETLSEKTIECALLERQAPGSSKYRTVKPDELRELLPDGLTGQGSS